jgi:NAD(P)-dependent dehydrogenase (short-subunit alcohol dehydrogenase family)
MSLKDRTALVTGAGTGIGKAIALAMAAEGAAVAVSDIDAESAEKCAAEAAESGARSLALTADAGEVSEIDGMIAATVSEFGRLDVMVNNAGLTRQINILDVTEADWDRIHRVNARGVFFCLQRAAKQMIAQGDGGAIINMASIAGRGYSGTSNAAYAASKGAVIAMTRVAAHQLGRHDITVNSICPGVTQTALLDRILEGRAEQQGISMDQAIENASRPIPIRRLNQPDDIAAMAVFLASAGARNITGQSYNVDGGLITS